MDGRRGYPVHTEAPATRWTERHTPRSGNPTAAAIRPAAFPTPRVTGDTRSDGFGDHAHAMERAGGREACSSGLTASGDRGWIVVAHGTCSTGCDDVTVYAAGAPTASPTPMSS